MRYLVRYIDPTTGREHQTGTGGDRQFIVRYANARNVIRFGLAGAGIPAGQFNIYEWPEGQTETLRFVRTAYKRA